VVTQGSNQREFARRRHSPLNDAGRASNCLIQNRPGIGASGRTLHRISPSHKQSLVIKTQTSAEHIEGKRQINSSSFTISDVQKLATTSEVASHCQLQNSVCIGQTKSNYRWPCWMVHRTHYAFEPLLPPSSHSFPPGIQMAMGPQNPQTRRVPALNGEG
jgi:hypothetical protein